MLFIKLPTGVTNTIKVGVSNLPSCLMAETVWNSFVKLGSVSENKWEEEQPRQ